MPGMTASQGATVMFRRPSARIAPHDGVGWRQAEAQEAERRLDEDHEAEVEQGDDQHDLPHGRQDVATQLARAAGAERPRGRDVVLVPLGEDPRPDDARIQDPAGMPSTRMRCTRVRSVMTPEDDDGEQDERERQLHVAHAHEHARPTSPARSPRSGRRSARGVAARSTAKKAMTSELRAPYISRLATSRPSVSVPRGWSHVPPRPRPAAARSLTRSCVVRVVRAPAQGASTASSDDRRQADRRRRRNARRRRKRRASARPRARVEAMETRPGVADESRHR